MRIRTIKPEFWINEKLCSLPEITHLFAAAILNYADDEGYFNANPGLIKGALFPIRDTSRSITVMLRELSEIGYLKVGETEDGRKYGLIINFSEHQAINKKKKSKIKDLEVAWYATVPIPDEHGTATTGNRDQGTGIREQGSGNIDPSLRSGSPNISVSTQESNTSYQLLPVSTSEDLDKTKTKTKIKTKGKVRDRGGNGEAKSTATWNAYADAYARRYGVSPVRNAKTSSLCCRLVDAIGADDAPRVASYYPSSNYGYYVARGHALELCLSDCQKLLTELDTGNRTTQTKAREADRLQHSGDGWKKIIEEMGE